MRQRDPHRLIQLMSRQLLSNTMEPIRHSTLGKLLSVTTYIQVCLQPLEPFRPPEWTTHCHGTYSSRESMAPWLPASHRSSHSKNRTPLTHQLSLVLDENRLLCGGGRIHNAPASKAIKFPVQLPNKSHDKSHHLWHICKSASYQCWLFTYLPKCHDIRSMTF